MSTTTTQTATRTTLTASDDSQASNSTTKDTTVKQPQQQNEEAEIYDEIEIEDMTYDSTLQIYHYPCPCGDRFEIAIASLRDGEDIAVCPGCSLTIRVIYDEGDLEKEGG